jgi:hypothetical protein
MVGDHPQQWIAVLTSAQMSRLWGGQKDMFGTLDCRGLQSELDVTW